MPNLPVTFNKTMSANPTDIPPINDDLIERVEGQPHFIHANDCPNYCDYTCNPQGFEQAETVRNCDHEMKENLCIKCGWTDLAL
jgi:hypothetical protein